MINIKNVQNADGTVTFTATGKHTLILRINENTAQVVSVTAPPDSDVYDGLVKTARAYAVRRGIEFDKSNIVWRDSQCQQNT